MLVQSETGNGHVIKYILKKTKTATQTQATILQFGNESLHFCLSTIKSLTVMPIDYQCQWYGTVQRCNKYCTIKYETLSDTKILLYNAINFALKQKIIIYKHPKIIVIQYSIDIKK